MTNKIDIKEVIQFLKKHGINETIQKFKISHARIKRLQEKYDIKPASTKTDRVYLKYKRSILKDLKNKERYQFIKQKYNLGGTVFYNILNKLKKEYEIDC